jgi:hypothetical protein
MAATAVIAGVAIASTTVSAVSSNQARQDAKGVAGKQERAQAAAAKELKDKQLTDQATSEREAIRARARALRAGVGGRKSTILTSPTGIPGGAAADGSGGGAGKTLIGA